MIFYLKKMKNLKKNQKNTNKCKNDDLKIERFLDSF